MGLGFLKDLVDVIIVILFPWHGWVWLGVRYTLSSDVSCYWNIQNTGHNFLPVDYLYGSCRVVFQLRGSLVVVGLIAYS